MKKESEKMMATLSFIALVIIALLLAIEYILPLIGVNIEGVLVNILNTVKNVFILIIIGVGAYGFLEGKAKWLVWVYWIAFAIIAVVTVLMWIL